MAAATFSGVDACGNSNQRTIYASSPANQVEASSSEITESVHRGPVSTGQSTSSTTVSIGQR